MFNRKLIPISIVVLTIFLSISTNGLAQTYLGITADVGNQINYQPNTGDTYFKRPITVSGNINFLKQEAMRNEWFFRYGLVAGVLGYNVKVLLKDTLNPAWSNTPDAFLDYTPLYVSIPLAIGKQFLIKEKKVTVFCGGGATYYYNFFPGGVSGSIAVMDNNSFEYLFDYELFPANDKLVAFADLSVQAELNKRVSVGLLYRHHFKAALEGSYNFYHVEGPSNGTLSVTQKTLSILFLVRVGKNFPE